MMISASHSTVRPPGAFAFQCERRSSVRRTEMRWFMNLGRFSKFRQKAYSSGAGVVMVVASSTLTPRDPPSAALVSDSRAVVMPVAA